MPMKFLNRWVVYNTEKIHMDYDPALVSERANVCSLFVPVVGLIRALMLPSSPLTWIAAQVPPEWHGWLHHVTDTPPDEMKRKVRQLAGVRERAPDASCSTGMPSSWQRSSTVRRNRLYKNPGHFLGGRVRGDGYLAKSGSVRPNLVAVPLFSASSSLHHHSNPSPASLTPPACPPSARQ
eukprot:384047-Hanusia_phi.AAC.1